MIDKIKKCECGCGANVKRRFLSGHQTRNRDMTLSNNPHWRGGRYINDAGYVMVYMPSHNRSSSNGYVREHILKAESAIGKPLPELARIHHYGDVSDNSKIIICENPEYHNLLHIRQAAVKNCGNATYRKCRFCQQYDNPKNLYIRHRGSREGWIVYHRECQNKYNREKKVSEKC